MRQATFSRIAACALLVLGLAGWNALGQGTGSISGRVLDASQAVIPGAEVTITNAATGITRTVLTSDDGNFRVTNLIPGDYSIEASLTGFKKARGRVSVTVGETVHANLVLEIGDVSETVEVTDVASTIEVEQGRVSSLVNKERIAELPLNGRNVFQLMQLAPGAVNTESTIFEPGQNTNVNGGRANMNGFWLDGVTSKALSGGTGAGDAAGTTPNLEAIQEFRIETMNFSAEYGDSVGSVVTVVSKSGSNQFHGSVYEFLRNDNLDGREYFDGPEPPEFKQNQYGFSLGGPVVKDSTFFFVSYEGTRIRTGESQLGTFESQAWANFVQGNGAPVARFLYANYPAPALTTVTSSVGQYLVDFGYIANPTQAEVDAFLGQATVFGSAPGAIAATAPITGETTFFTPDSTDNNGYSIRVDQEFGDSDKLYGRYFFNKSVGLVVDARPAFNSDSISKNHQLAFNWSHIFSPSMVNEARVGLTRNIGDIFAGTPGVAATADFGSGTSAFGAYNGYPQIFHENIFTYADTLSITKGNHGLKMGGELRRNQENSEFNVGRPSYYFFDLVSIGLDDPYYQVGGVNPHLDLGPGNAELSSNFRGWRNWELGIFVNDDWKLKPNFTVNLGLRWDWYSRLTEVQNRATKYDFSCGNGNLFAGVRCGSFTGPVDSLSANDWNNFAPRIGFAWDPFSNGKMSIRGGYGVAFQSGIYNPLANSRWNKPFYSFNGVCAFLVCGSPGEVVLYGPQGGQAVTATGQNPNPGASGFEGNIIAYDPNNVNKAFLSGIPSPSLRDPYVQSFFFGIQRELFRDTVFEVNYVGTLGRKLIRAENPNRFPGDLLGAASPNGEFAGDTSRNRVNPNEGVLRVWENNVNSNYHALQVQLNKRYSGGFAFNMNYTWAKSLDVRSTWHSGATSANGSQEGYSTDIFNVGLDYGRSIFDARHRLVVNWLYDLPWFRDSGNWAKHNILGGWQVNGIVALQSGQPFTPYCSLSFFSGCDFNADDNRNDRPNANFGSTANFDRLDFVNPNNGAFHGFISGSTTAERLAAFGTPTPGTVGQLGRNTFSGPNFANWDFSVFKEVAIPPLGEEGKLQLRFEFFNLFNRPNFFQPNPVLNSGTFGRSTQSFDAREIQIGIKVLF